jgi:uncharacterized protein
VRAVIDTNIVVSAFINRGGLPSKLLEVWKNRKYEWLLSNALYFELRDVLFRPVIKEAYHISSGEISAFLDYIERACILISPQEEYHAPFLFSPDTKDNKVLQCAGAGKADYLVTGDKKDLFLLNGKPQLGNTQIVSVRSFLGNLGS